MSNSREMNYEKFPNLRKEYKRHALSESDVDPDPIKQFQRWFDHAVAAGVDEPNAMMLATATPDGHPSGRIVLLKSCDERGFGFYTNYGSRKGLELERNPRAALVFHWHGLERQVRVEGKVEKVSRKESAEYFGQRPRESRIAAWASRQSSELASRKELEEEYLRKAKEFKAGDVPVPEFWGGFLVVPVRLEFWQGRESRLHDRIEYVLKGNDWSVHRLSP